MGCGSSNADPQPATTQQPRPVADNKMQSAKQSTKQPVHHDDTDDEETPLYAEKKAKPEMTTTSCRGVVSKANIPAPAPQPEVGNILDELFEFDDCKILVSEVLKAKQERMLRVRRPLERKRTAVVDGESKLTWGDFQLKKVEHERVFSVSMVHNYSSYSLVGHNTRVKCVALSPTENQYVSCSSEDSSLILWDRETGREMGTFMGHDDTILCVVFSPDNKNIATCSRDNHMILWDIITMKQVLTFEHPRVVICCSFTPDAKYLVSGCQDKICRVWDTRRGKEAMNFGRHEAIVVSLCVMPREDMCKGGQYPVCSGSADKTVRVWTAFDPSRSSDKNPPPKDNNEQHIILQGHQGIVFSCQYSQDCKYITSSDEKLAKVWSVADNACICTFSVDNISATLVNKMPKRLTWTLVYFLPSKFGLCIAAISNTRLIHILDVERELKKVNYPEGPEVLQLYARSPVHCLSIGNKGTMVYGDSFGNMYVTILK